MVTCLLQNQKLRNFLWHKFDHSISGFSPNYICLRKLVIFQGSLLLRNSMLLMLTRNLEGQEELITQLWQKAIFKLGKIQCSVCNKYVTKKKEILGFFVFVSFLQKIKTHSQILGKKLETVTSETLKIKTQFLRNSTSEI